MGPQGASLTPDPEQGVKLSRLPPPLAPALSALASSSFRLPPWQLLPTNSPPPSPHYQLSRSSSSPPPRLLAPLPRSAAAPCPRHRRSPPQSGPLGAETAAAPAASPDRIPIVSYSIPPSTSRGYGAGNREQLSTRGALRGACGAQRCGRARLGQRWGPRERSRVRTLSGRIKCVILHISPSFPIHSHPSWARGGGRGNGGGLEITRPIPPDPPFCWVSKNHKSQVRSER